MTNSPTFTSPAGSNPSDPGTGAGGGWRPGRRVAVVVVVGCVMVGCFLLGRGTKPVVTIEETIASYEVPGGPSEEQSVARLVQLMGLPTMEKRAEDLSALIEDLKTYITTLTNTDEKWYIHGLGKDVPRQEPTPGSGTDSRCGGIDNDTGARSWTPQSLALPNVGITDAQWEDLVTYARARAGRIGIDVEGLRIDKPSRRVLTLVNRHGDDFSINVHEDRIVMGAWTSCLLTDEMKQTIRDTGQPDQWPYTNPPNL